MTRSSSVRFRVNDYPENAPRMANKTSCKSLSNPILNDGAEIKIGLEDNKVVFVKNSNTPNLLTEEAPNTKIENGVTRNTHTIPSDNLLSVGMSNTEHNIDAGSSITTLDVNLEMSSTYLHPSSMLSCATATTVVNSVNGEHEQTEALLERSTHQRDSSGSIRAAVARRKQNMTHRSAAQKREANLAVVLVSSVTMFLICHAPRIFANL